MNITFLIIAIVSLMLIVFIRNTFNINTNGYRGLIWWLITICLIDSIGILINASLVIQFPHVLWLTLPLKLLIAPYTFQLLTTKSLNKKKSLSNWHFVPAVLVLALLFPVFMLDGSPKLNLVTSPNWQLVLSKYLLILQLIAYLGISIHQNLKRTVRQKGRRQANIRLLAGLFLYTVVVIMDGIKLPGVATIVANALLGVAALSYLVFMHRVENSKTSVIEPGIIERIEQLMIKEKLYLQPELTLSRMAKSMDLSTHKISKALNSQLSCGYNDYINRYRVSEAIRLLKDEANEKYTFEAISKMAGFGSLTTFNTAFKKVTGKTPRQFKL